ncbi:lipoprotein [Lysobacter enzymogenes]|uniref:Lipoprotein n=1 Tax=Lysobacter enzymogenes TaxID=69 RepID=A0A0S2DMG5_LYSEN|nr:lipoprotein [Lysobacter enzymogenes]
MVRVVMRPAMKRPAAAVRRVAACGGLALALACALAGPAWAGDAAAANATPADTVAASATVPDTQALVAEYKVRDARGERSLTLVRSADRIEYRQPGEPAELWRQTPDGIARLELFAAEKRSVAWAPGDLRTTGRMPQWEQLASPINPQLRDKLKRDGSAKVLGLSAERYRGESAEGQAIALEWLSAEGLPAYYRTGPAKPKAGDTGFYELKLVKLERVGAQTAFTATGDYRETDYADLGDMELDPFAAAYLKRNGHAH